MSQDNGSWLSAEQAVMPDGSERHNLPLVKKKLPQFSPEQAAHAEPAAQAAEPPATSPARPDQG